MALITGGPAAGASAASATPRSATPTRIVVHTTDGVDDPFESNIVDCNDGSTNDRTAIRQLTRTHGVFNGSEAFTGTGGRGGFTVHLNASFTFEGSSGTWSILSAWGTMAGLRGQGQLVGSGGVGIDDTYQGHLFRTT